MRTKVIQGSMIVVVLGLGFLGGLVFQKSQLAHCVDTYQFINHDIACGAPDVVRKTGYIETTDSLNAYIKALQAEGSVSEVSVYFRDLVHGPVFGINELTDFAPASLLKLPLAFVFLSVAEDEPEILDKKIEFTGTTTVEEQTVTPRESAQPDHPYTIDELLRLMLVHSDNASYETLEQFLVNVPSRIQLRLETFQEIGFISPTDRVEDTVSVRGYASLFRSLYNASYLNADMSEKVLAWLAASEYDQGLAAGVPSGVSIAHKFGERVLDDGAKQLHDCGIVYYPKNPYLLCVMTRGTDFAKLEGVIGTISQIVYEEFDARKL